MSFIPLLLATILYCFTSVGFMVEGDRPMAIVYLGYAFANIGMLLISLQVWKRTG